MTSGTQQENRWDLVQCVLDWERERAEEVFLVQPHSGGQTIEYTWREVADQARRMAAHLQGLNLPAGSSIGLLGKNTAHWIIADIAIYMAGHVSVPLYPTLSVDTARYVLGHCDVKLLFIGKMNGVGDNWAELEQGLPAELPVIGLPLSPCAKAPQWNDLLRQHAPAQQLAARRPDDLATIIYTSGSTGEPKGVMHSFRSMIAAVSAGSELWGINSKERLLSYLPLAHTAERAAVECGAIYFGCQVYFSEGIDTFLQDLQRAKPTVFFSVPRLWSRFHRSINEKIPPRLQAVLFSVPFLSGWLKRRILTVLGLNHVRVALSGSAPLPPTIIEWYRNLGLELFEVYAMTEDFGNSHANRLGEVRIGYVGTPTPGTLCRISDEGEILIKSASQMLGYYRREQETRESYTADGYFRTGDCGEHDEQRRLRITGRLKDIFKTSKGKYVAPVPIEHRFDHPAVEISCVVGASQPQPFVLLMLSPEARQAAADSEAARLALMEELGQVVQGVNTKLEDHEKLAYAVVVKESWTIENGLLTPSLKLRRNLIEKRYLPQADQWRAEGAVVVVESQG